MATATATRPEMGTIQRSGLFEKASKGARPPTQAFDHKKRAPAPTEGAAALREYYRAARTGANLGGRRRLSWDTCPRRKPPSPPRRPTPARRRRAPTATG